jgi:acetyl-CoA C-acetyltransferase
MGAFAEITAQKFGFTRGDQDAFATQSVRRAQAACESGAFATEVTAVVVKDRKGERTVSQDETPYTLDIAKIPSLKPAFDKNGTVTPASSSSISDGAAALVVTSESFARQHRLQPLARIVAHASHAQEPEWFTTAPIGAIAAVLSKAGWKAEDVDLYEVNEAFACVTMAATQELKLDPAKVNVHGGACALGHPIGATGARIATTLLHAMKAKGLKRGIASLCIGGGEAAAVAFEMI